jgi:hypothetical protein
MTRPVGVTRNIDSCVMRVCPYTVQPNPIRVRSHVVASSQPNCMSRRIYQAGERAPTAAAPTWRSGGRTMLSTKRTEQGRRHLGRAVRETFTCVRSYAWLLLPVPMHRPPPAGDSEPKATCAGRAEPSRARQRSRSEQGSRTPVPVPPVSGGQGSSVHIYAAEFSPGHITISTCTALESPVYTGNFVRVQIVILIRV